MSEVAIRAQGLSKRYRLGAREGHSWTLHEALRRAAASPFSYLRQSLRPPSEEETLWALREVSFEIEKGDAVGIIGSNGAGKSTLLKILSRITEPTEGGVELYGRVASLLEVGTGFHPELPGRDNVYLNGAILGMTRREIKRRYDEIVDFAGLERFMDTPVKRYSSGMYVRLAFAVAAHLEPEILLVDEVLAVGDSAFQKKCIGRIGNVVRGGRTVLFVSHSMASVRELCRRCMWIHSGRLQAVGPTAEVISAYLKDQSPKAVNECSFEEDPEKDFQVRSARFEDDSGGQRFDCDQPVVLILECQVHQRIPRLYGYFVITTPDGTTVMTSDSYDEPGNPLDGVAVGFHTLSVAIPARSLAPGDYELGISFSSGASRRRDFVVDDPGKILTFRLDDFLTRRGNQRRGFFSTRLRWEIRDGR